MRSCMGCIHANWDQTESGRLHPSGDGKCGREYKLAPLPASMYWVGPAPRPSGGHINRRKYPAEHCLYWKHDFEADTSVLTIDKQPDWPEWGKWYTVDPDGRVGIWEQRPDIIAGCWYSIKESKYLWLEDGPMLENWRKCIWKIVKSKRGERHGKDEGKNVKGRSFDRETTGKH